MARHARLTPQARADLQALRDWLTQEAGVLRARRFVDRLRGHCSDLAATPLAGRSRPELGPGVRSTVLPPYVILYEPRPYGMRVLRIIHGHRDIDRVWREET
jgi:toxin ParE1/3/4